MKCFKWVLIVVCFAAYVMTPICGRNPAPIETGVGRRSLRKDGDIILAGLLTVHHKTADDHCGVIKPQGLAYVEAMIFAIEEINKDNELLPNVTLGYDIQDYCDNVMLASESAFAINTRNLLFEYFYNSNKTDLAQEIFGEFLKPVAAVIGTADSSSSMVVASMLQVRQIPQVSPFATSEELTSNDYKTFYRTVPSDRQQAKAIADIIDHFGWSYVTIIGVDSSYGRWGVLSIEHEAQRRKTFCIHASEIFPTTRYETKVTSIITRLKQESWSKVVVLWADPTTSLFVLEEARSQQVHGLTWLGPEGWSEASSLYRQDYLPVIGGFLGTLFQEFDISNYKQYMLNLKRGSSRLANTTWWSEVWKLMYQKCSDNITIDPTALAENACVNGQYSKVTEHMYSEMNTAYIPYVIDAVFAVAHAIDGVYRCKNGTGPLFGGRCPQSKPHLSSEDVLYFLRNISFYGITGAIHFDENGNSEQTAAYSVVNLQPNVSTDGKSLPGVKTVGSWTRRNSPRLKLQNDTVYWNNGSKSVPESVCSKICPAGKRQSETINCCWTCNECSPDSYSDRPGSHNCTKCPIDKKPNIDHTACVNLPILNRKMSDMEPVVVFVLSCLGFALLLFVLAVFIKLRDTALVKASNWKLSCVLLFGIALGYMTSSVYVMLPTTRMCCLSEAGNRMYFVVCVSVLFLKTNRLIHIFEMKVFSSSLTKWFYSGKNQFFILMLLNFVPVLALTVWYIFDRPRVHREIDVLKTVYYECVFYSGNIGYAMHVVVFVYSIALSILCTFYAFKARKLPSNFNEAQYIGFAMYIQLLCHVTLFGIYNNLQGYQAPLFYGSVILVSTFGFLFCMFAPKLYVIFRHPERNTAEFLKSAVSNHNLTRTMRQIQVHHGKSVPNRKISNNNALKRRSETSMTNTSTISEANELQPLGREAANSKMTNTADNNERKIAEAQVSDGKNTGALENGEKNTGDLENGEKNTGALEKGEKNTGALENGEKTLAL